MNIFPFRIRFAKQGKSRFLSHHDLLRTLERAIRRSGLPVRMTEGYNPHPRLSMPTALGLGIESDDEVVEVELNAWTAPREVQRLLSAQMPQGFSVRSVEAFSRKERSRVDAVEYVATLTDPPPNLADAVRDLMAAREAVVQRSSDKRSKLVDVRSYILDLRVEERALRMTLRVTDQGAAKPEEVLELLGVDPLAGARIVKTRTDLARRA